MTENSFVSDGFEVTSSSETAAEIQAALTPAATEPAKAPEAPQEEGKAAPEADGGGDEADKPLEAAKEPEKGEEKKPDHRGKPKYDPTARVMQATRQAAEAKKERDELAKRYEEAQAELAKFKGKPEATPKPAPEGKPKPDDFETYEEYTEALTDWKIEQRETAKEEARRQEAFQASAEKRVKAFQERIGQHLQANPDFWERVSPDVVTLRPLSVLAQDEPKGALNALAEHFITSEYGPALMMYFTDHPDEIQRFSALHPIQFGVELGKIEVGLGAASTATVPKTQASKARPPVRPVTGSPTTDPDEIDDDAPFEAFVKHRNAQERAARSHR